MILLNNDKFACETCIKGHRSSTCQHTDRPLFEIKKKGRPVTQCDHCRELRKTKQVHVKCICETKEDIGASQSSGVKKGHTKIPDCATFPLGLPEALGASVALQASSEGPSSDSDHGGTKNSCSCAAGEACHCCIPRKSAPRNRKKDAARPQRPPAESYDTPRPSGSRTPSHILARLAELRPVLPRPSRSRSDSGPLHDASSGIAHGHSARPENHLFSPYGRAYDMTHEHAYDDGQDQQLNDVSQNFSVPSTSLFPYDEQIFRDQLHALEAAAASSWLPPQGSESGALSFPSTCGCGDSCSCPGCVQHNGASAAPSSSAFSSCMNPGACNTCLDCTILSLPASLPPDTSLSINDAYQAESIDEWIRQVSQLPRSSPGMVTSPMDDQAHQPPPPNWDPHLPPIVEPIPNLQSTYTVQPCCGGLCECSPGYCQCSSNDENGYDCRKEMLTSDFATAGGGISSPSTSLAPSGGSMPYATMRNHSDNGLYMDSGAEGGRFLGIPEPPRSRSSSLSSQSSRGQPPHHHPFTNQPLGSEYSFAGAPAGRVRGPFNPGLSISSPNLGLGLKLQTEFSNSRSAGSSPSSTSPTRSMIGRGNVSYAVSNPDSDGYISADDRNPQMRWRGE
ncbi:Metal-binding regulatory protein cuf1 [Hypsizygus marmoreus]|uniref:Metal-binding regulatory protein cuf1 n=1 Tax=Hypsizygus marmoreus TaxID=39966 RepID=A0A369K2S6_HYPMA|nr:Metal-binding regulatory protein cuf1 [Hypsizygus marmoreus]